MLHMQRSKSGDKGISGTCLACALCSACSWEPAVVGCTRRGGLVTPFGRETTEILGEMVSAWDQGWDSGLELELH